MNTILLQHFALLVFCISSTFTDVSFFFFLIVHTSQYLSQITYSTQSEKEPKQKRGFANCLSPGQSCDLTKQPYTWSNPFPPLPRQSLLMGYSGGPPPELLNLNLRGKQRDKLASQKFTL